MVDMSSESVHSLVIAQEALFPDACGSFDWSGSQLLRLRAHGFFDLLVLIDI